MKLHQGLVLYTDETPIGFGKGPKTIIKKQGRYEAKAWPKYKRAGFKHRQPSRKEYNKKYINGVIGNPLMNSELFRPTSEYIENYTCEITGKKPGKDNKRRPDSTNKLGLLEKRVKKFYACSKKKFKTIQELKEKIAKEKIEYQELRRSVSVVPDPRRIYNSLKKDITDTTNFCYENRRKGEMRFKQMNEEESAIKNLLKRKDQAEKVLNRERNRCEKLSLENQDLHNEIRDLKKLRDEKADELKRKIDRQINLSKKIRENESHHFDLKKRYIDKITKIYKTKEIVINERKRSRRRREDEHQDA